MTPAPEWIRTRLLEGIVIPAHPLALTADRRLDERRQRALTRYYQAAGAGGIAVGVHTTQFAIRESQHGLFEPVLRLASETAAARDRREGTQTLLVAGVCGSTEQAIGEATLARECGYHAGLLSLAAFPRASDAELIAHCARVAEEIPLFGFYLQPAVGGRVLRREFWAEFLDIPNVVAIKVAPFNRYQTLDVVRALAESGRANEVALYTGNDDNIIVDLLTEFRVAEAQTETRVPGFAATPRRQAPQLEICDAAAASIQIAGGLLGHWACWTRRAVEMLEKIKRARRKTRIRSEWLTRAAQVTECNAAIFDAANGYAGCIAGIHEVLRRQGLLAGTWCLDPNEDLSPGQAEEIERVSRSYPELIDDDFVSEHLEQWLRDEG